MSYNPLTDMLLILTTNHQAGRRLAFNAQLDPRAYEIITHARLERVKDFQDGFYVLCTGSSMRKQNTRELELAAGRQGLKSISHAEVMQAGRLANKQGGV